MKKYRLKYWPLLILWFLLGMLIAKVSRLAMKNRTQDQLPKEINISPDSQQDNTVKLLA